MSPIEAISVLQGDQKEFLEELYQEYVKNPDRIAPEWRNLFSELDGRGGTRYPSAGASLALQPEDIPDTDDINLKAHRLIQDYRRHGHFLARVNPLGFRNTDENLLDPQRYGIGPHDLQKIVRVQIAGQPVTDTLATIINKMEQIYCSSTGIEYFYIRDEERRNWIAERVESDEFYRPLSREQLALIYSRVYAAEAFEKFLATRFPGKKRFSLEGGESLIPALACIVEEAGNYSIEQIVLGMAHRGRLNVLANIMGKDPAAIFAEFNENVSSDFGPGDVKYHLGYSRDYKTKSGRMVHLSLAFNPSHLEVINPVVMGSVRARQTMSRDERRLRHLPVLIHGDAALAGQGINYECANMSGLRGYSVGGTIHVVVNNQVGFTTDPKDSRSTIYATDLAKILNTPILHVNGDDPVAVFRAARFALEWRQTFNSDVFIDLICFRRWGHNETDEPTFTQPGMYEIIKKHPGTFAVFDRSLPESELPSAEREAIRNGYNQTLEEAFQRFQSQNIQVDIETLQGKWQGLRKIDPESNPETGVSETVLKKVTEIITFVPDGFNLNKKLQRLFEDRRKMIFEPQASKGVDWGMGELLAYGTLLAEGFSVRISGQDCKRGTFSHRHATVFDTETGEEFTPLSRLAGQKTNFEIVNSLLSEEAVLGFEFGYSLADPSTLVIWEAQFGDFANGAQVIVDQFISSSEAKWKRMSGLTMLLPHGYEGQGPEHSSARLERYLQLCSQHNMQVCYPTTPAQIFHLLRRQMHRNYRKPLIVMSPKSLLRHPEAVCKPEDFLSGRFQDVIPEVDPDIKAAGVKRILFCTGKIYYELREERRKAKITDTAIIRVEQLYPFPDREIQKLLDSYRKVEEVAWVQEEPRNQGAWIYMENLLGHLCKNRLNYYGRPASPSPATGYYKVHVKEQQTVLNEALLLNK